MIGFVMTFSDFILRRLESVLLAERQLVTYKELFSIKLLDKNSPTMIKFNESTCVLTYSIENAGTGARAREREKVKIIFSRGDVILQTFPLLHPLEFSSFGLLCYWTCSSACVEVCPRSLKDDSSFPLKRFSRRAFSLFPWHPSAGKVHTPLLGTVVTNSNRSSVSFFLQIL